MTIMCHFFLFILCSCSVIGQSSKTKENSSTNYFPHRLSSLLRQNFDIALNDTKYSVVLSEKIIRNVTNLFGNASRVHTLGRSNDTDILETDSWIFIMYGSGDPYNGSEQLCIGARKAIILVNCNVDVHKPEIKYVGFSEHWKNNGCIYMFELTTNVICPSHVDTGLSRGSVFCIVVLTAVGVYFIIGVCYRRLVVGAKGFEQIPHHKFWTRLTNLKTNGCSSICRRQEEETWQRLTGNPSNAKETHDEQDDALLRP